MVKLLGNNNSFLIRMFNQTYYYQFDTIIKAIFSFRFNRGKWKQLKVEETFHNQHQLTGSSVTGSRGRSCGHFLLAKSSNNHVSDTNSQQQRN